MWVSSSVSKPLTPQTSGSSQVSFLNSRLPMFTVIYQCCQVNVFKLNSYCFTIHQFLLQSCLSHWMVTRSRAPARNLGVTPNCFPTQVLYLIQLQSPCLCLRNAPKLHYRLPPPLLQSWSNLSPSLFLDDRIMSLLQRNKTNRPCVQIHREKREKEIYFKELDPQPGNPKKSCSLSLEGPAELLLASGGQSSL